MAREKVGLIKSVRDTLLPVRVETFTLLTRRAPPEIRAFSCLVSADGRVITPMLPTDELVYMRDRINGDVKAVKHEDKKLLAHIIIPGKPPHIMWARHVKMSGADKAMPTMVKHPDYLKYVKRFDKKFPYYVLTPHCFPIRSLIKIKMTLTINPTGGQGTMTDYMQIVESVLYDVGIIEKSHVNAVQSWDGSTMHINPILEQSKSQVELVIREM